MISYVNCSSNFDIHNIDLDMNLRTRLGNIFYHENQEVSKSESDLHEALMGCHM